MDKGIKGLWGGSRPRGRPWTDTQKVGWVIGTSGSTLTAASLEDVKGCGGVCYVSSSAAWLRVSTGRNRWESEIEVSHSVQLPLMEEPTGAAAPVSHLLRLPGASLMEGGTQISKAWAGLQCEKRDALFDTRRVCLRNAFSIQIMVRCCICLNR